MKTIPNLYILEGGEGVFKTSIAKKLAEEIPNAVYLRDPGGNALCEKIRELILENEMIPYTEMFLFLASRATLFDQEIMPLIDKGKIVIMDRLYLSNVVYQGIVRGCGVDKVILGNRWIMGDQCEAATFLLDLDVEKALARCKDRPDNNRLDEYGINFHNRVRQGYLEASKTLDNVLIVDATDFNEAYAVIYSYIMCSNAVANRRRRPCCDKAYLTDLEKLEVSEPDTPTPLYTPPATTSTVLGNVPSSKYVSTTEAT